MEILTEETTVSALKSMAEKMFGTMVKAVVDVRLGKIAVDAELHSDEEALLLESGSLQEDLWGINIYPEYEKTDTNFVEFDSMINVRPSQGNRSRSVEDAQTREKILAVVNEWIV
ncbi:MAG TPA: DUF5674 family protein [Chitinivibrionales bacterium]|nr:DUF5674 family protein [Chitinivibrionales bacterium]